MRPLFSLLLRCTCSLNSWFCEALSASCFLFLTEASYTYILRLINSFFLVLLDAFSSRFLKTNVIFLYILFSSTYISFMFPLPSVSFGLARCSFRLFPNFRCVTLTLTQTSAEMPFEAYIVM
jgi:hypothetical protein